MKEREKKEGNKLLGSAEMVGGGVMLFITSPIAVAAGFILFAKGGMDYYFAKRAENKQKQKMQQAA